MALEGSSFDAEYQGYDNSEMQDIQSEGDKAKEQKIDWAVHKYSENEWHINLQPWQPSINDKVSFLSFLDMREHTLRRN